MVRGETKINKFYVALAILVVMLIIIAFIFSGNQITRAVVEDKYLTDDWADLGMPTYEEGFFGLEKQASIKYGLEDDAANSTFLRVITIKTLFMISEDELIEKTEETIIESAVQQNITLDQTSRVKDSRVLANGHKTFYVIYNGSKLSNETYLEVSIIGEAWNCARSGTSIICIGYSEVKNNDYSSLIKILGDPSGTFSKRFKSPDFANQEGLIFNVKCH